MLMQKLQQISQATSYGSGRLRSNAHLRGCNGRMRNNGGMVSSKGNSMQYRSVKCHYTHHKVHT